IVLSQPMLAGTRLQTNVVAPTKPGIALENGFGLMECCKSIFALAGMIKINTQVDKRVGFGLEDMMRAADFKTAVIVFARLVEVLQLAVNPADAIRKTRKLETIAVALSHLYSIIKCSQGFGHPTKISTRQPKSKQR